MRGTLHSDGGSRGNPGPSGIGYVLVIEGREPIAHAEYIGASTNNQAEYAALLTGLERAFSEGVQELTCYLDSELLVRQLSGSYRVKDAKLKPLFVRVQELRKQFASIEFQHVGREKNKEADELVNKAIDEHESAASLNPV